MSKQTGHKQTWLQLPYFHCKFRGCFVVLEKGKLQTPFFPTFQPQNLPRM